MKIRLVSQDPDLYKLCSEILAEFSEPRWEITTAATEDADTGLSVWDYEPDLPLPQGTDWTPARHLFLVNRKDVAAFQEVIGYPEVTILLKPVTRATLNAFLSHAISAHQDRVSSTVSLRADRDEMLQCVIQANLKLQEYDQDRTNFLARAIHDFRAPLTAINGYCGLLLSEAVGPIAEEQKEVLDRMQHSAKRLSRMASAMFQLSVGRHVKRRPEFRKCVVQNCIEQALHETAPQAKSKQISVSVDLEPETRPLFFEEGMIEQLLINLLDNACRFTPRNGEIDVRGYPFFWDRRGSSAHVSRERRQQRSQEPNAYRIDIRNSGAQIPAPHLKSIFEEYTTYSGAQDRSGGGLGLAICRMIALQHEGRIWAENSDSGPIFSFVLPAHGADVVQADPDQPEVSNYAEVS
ncbi:MAG TPA: HAMP domain-containing sensor histidine kinase [Bryobacteraceae bacterium]|nr:HAMP domain-containing sensor histidine kinase [Bryobacteraceae bacterium]